MDKLIADHDVGAALLLQPTRLFRATEIIADFTSVPKSSGVYAWYFDEVPPGVSTDGCHQSDRGQVLLYVGIAPKKSAAGTVSKRTLRHRLRDHLVGNAEGSTQRLTLGCLLADELGLQLRRVGSGKRRTFTNPGEVVLDG